MTREREKKSNSNIKSLKAFSLFRCENPSRMGPCFTQNLDNVASLRNTCRKFTNVIDFNYVVGGELTVLSLCSL